MSILSDGELYQALDAGSLRVEMGDCEAAGRVQPASIDLSLETGVTLEPHGFALASTAEKVTVGPALAAQISGRSSWGRRGLQVHATAGWIDPGFSGQVTLELSNLTDATLVVPTGVGICQLIVMRLGRPALRPYGHVTLGSKYQNQVGVTAARN